MKSKRKRFTQTMAIVMAATMCLGMTQAAFATEADPEEPASELICSDQADIPEDEDVTEDQTDVLEEENVAEEQADAPEEQAGVMEEDATEEQADALEEEDVPEEQAAASEKDDVAEKQTGAKIGTDDADYALSDGSEDSDPTEAANEGYVLDGADDYTDEYGIAMASTTDSGTTGNLTWTLSGGVLTISGSGDMPDYSSYSSTPWYSYRNSITSIVVSSGVTTVGKYSFCYAQATTVTLPGTLTAINEGAFTYCTQLTGVDIPDKVTSIGRGAFAYCYDITSITLGSKVQTVGQYAFQGTAITSLTIPASVTSFSCETCYGCKSLTAYNVASGNTSYASASGVLFNYGKTKLIRYPVGNTATSYSVPGTVTEIGDEVFYNATHLKSITLTSKIKTIGDWAFDGCTSLTSITIPDSVTSIGYGICCDCTALTTAVIGKGVTCLEYETFFNCTSLSSVTLGSGLESMDSRAFYNCVSLTKITLPSSLTTINNYAFYKCTGLTSITIPSSVTLIGQYAFYQCSSNLVVNCPSTLTLMDDGSYRVAETLKISGTCDYTKAYEVLKLVNQERSAEGLSSLTMDKDLLNAAMQRAAETNIYFSHTRPSGISCFTVSSKASGENIAAGYSTASAVMTGWMNSSGHKANILGSSYNSIGIGCFTQGGVTYWVQLFGGSSATTVSQPSNAKKTFSVIIDPSKFSNCMYLYTSIYGVNKGDSLTLSARLTNPEWTSCYAELDNSSLTWSSGKTSVATVSSGKVTGKSAGNVTISAKTSNGKLSASITLAVRSSDSSSSGSSSASSSTSKKPATPTISKVKNTASGVKITWGKVSGASGYYVYRKTGSSGSYKKIATIKSGSTVSYTNKTSGSYKVSAGKTYYYKVAAYKGSTKGSKSSAVKIVRLTRPSITSLKNASSKKMTVQWKKRTGATGYQVQYATNKSFTKNKHTVTVKGKSTTKKTISKLKKGKTYYVRVRTYKSVNGKKYYSAWSKVKKVKIKK